MVITTKHLDFVHRPDFYKPENTTLRKQAMFWHRLWKGKFLVFL
jgi:hypothetical protein